MIQESLGLGRCSNVGRSRSSRIFIASVVGYEESGAMLLISTAPLSSPARPCGPDLGHTMGSLPGGSHIYEMIGINALSYQVIWLRNGPSIAIASDVPIERLITIAADALVL